MYSGKDIYVCMLVGHISGKGKVYMYVLMCQDSLYTVNFNNSNTNDLF